MSTLADQYACQALNLLFSFTLEHEFRKDFSACLSHILILHIEYLILIELRSPVLEDVEQLAGTVKQTRTQAGSQDWSPDGT
jgi:hypothetical protein